MNAQATPNENAVKVALHYGTMRFSMFTVFTAIIGALLVFPFSEGGRAFFSLAANAPLKAVYGQAALILSVLFTLAELRISYLVSFYQEKAFGEDFAVPGGHFFWSLLVAATMIVPYVFSAIFFWMVFIDGGITLAAP